MATIKSNQIIYFYWHNEMLKRKYISDLSCEGEEMRTKTVEKPKPVARNQNIMFLSKEISAYAHIVITQRFIIKLKSIFINYKY